MLSNLMSVEDAARMLKVTKCTVYRWIKAGKIKAVRKDGQNLVMVNKIKYKASDLMKIYGISVSTYKRWMKDIRKNYPELLEESNPLRRYIILSGKYEAFVHWLTYLTPKTFSQQEIFDAYMREASFVLDKDILFSNVHVKSLRKAVKNLAKKMILIKVGTRYVHARHLKTNEE